MLILRLALLVALASGVVLFADDEVKKKPTPKFKLGKDTTFVTEPIDEDGYVDYETALNTLLKGKSTSETNAVVLLTRVFGPKPEGTELKPDFYKWLGVEPPPADGDYLISHWKLFEKELRGEDVQAFNDLESRLRQKPWKPEDSPKHVEWLNRNAKPLAVAVEATKRKDYFHPMIARKPDGKRSVLLNALLPIVQKCREIASALSIRAMLKLGEGKIEEAFEDVLAIHRLARLVSRGGSLIELLVGVALQAIAHNSEAAILEHGKPTAKQCLAYRDELLKLPPMATVADKLSRFERFNFLDAVQSMPREGMTNIPGVPDLGVKNAEEVLKAIDVESIFRLGNSWFDRIETAVRKPSRAERVEAGLAIEEELKKLTERAKNVIPNPKAPPEKLRAQVSEQIGTVFIGLLMPAFAKISDASDRSEQIHRNGLLMTALAAHLADEKKYPEKLSELVPKYLEKLSDDMFSGKAIVYRKTDTGYLLYGIGVNGKDDGGRFHGDQPPGDDVGVRMPRK